MEFIRTTINWLSDPTRLLPIAAILFLISIRIPAFWSRKGGLVALGLVTGFMGISLLDPNFRIIVTKPDNVPIVGLIFLVGFFTWLALHQGFANDRRIAEGKLPAEKETTSDKVWVWPDLVYTELISMVIFGAVMIVWSGYLKAPLEEPANPSVAPNPSKAPWYFLGLQEMLVYYDPWIAGVFLPSLIIVGLMATPFLDVNPKGNGYFTFKERKYEITVFLFGFVILWVLLIILGTFLRGPNWNFFGPYEYWDVHYLLPLNNVNLSEFIFVKWFKTGLPQFWLLRELPGIILVILYFMVTPLVFAKTWFRKFFLSMGAVRFQIMMFLLLCMFSLPIKMVLRWTMNLKYIVAIPEYFFNI
jgi:Cytochrome b(C-terminal)/b6/petD